MADIPAKFTPLTPEEAKEIQGYLKEKNVDIQIRFAPQKIRRMEDNGLVIDPPQFSTQLVKITPPETKGNGKLETV